MGHFALLDPDPDSEYRTDPDSEYGSGSTDLIEFGYNPDPDPKPCFFERVFVGGGGELYDYV